MRKAIMITPLKKLISDLVQPNPFAQPMGSCGYGGVAGSGGFCGNFL